MKKKILFISAGFKPAVSYGGPAISAENFCNLLCDECDIYVVAPNHELHKKAKLENIQESWNKFSNYFVKYVDDSSWKKSDISTITKEIMPDVVYINSLFSYPFVFAALFAAKKHKIPVVLATRGQLSANAMKKKWKKLPYLIAYKCLTKTMNIVYQATSDDEYAQIKDKLGNKKRIFKLPNIPARITTDKETQKIKNELRMVYIARIHPIKNLDFALKTLISCKGKVCFDVYGPMEDEEYWNKCKAIIQQLPENIIVTYKGVLLHNEIESTLSNYDVFYLPTQTENYGHSIVEAILAGCVPLISNNTPWNKLMDYEAGWALPLDDDKKFTDVICKITDESEIEFLERRKKLKRFASTIVDYEKIKKEYIEVLKNLGEAR